MKQPLTFLKKQKLLTLATRDTRAVWAANVYFAIDDAATLYFVSPTDTIHSKMILKNPRIAFSVAWFDPRNHKNRKSVQGRGDCRIVKNPLELARGIKLLWKNFPDMRDILTVKWIVTNAWGTKLWAVKPTYIKYWDDALYGDDESKEFRV